MVSILVLFIGIIAIAINLFVITFLHYLLHKYINKNSICYYDDRIYLLRYDTIDILINITDDAPKYYPKYLYL